MKDRKDNQIYQKSLNFALKVIKIYKYLSEEKKEFILSKQFLKAGTSIGANVSEAIEGQSRRDFISKFSISLKEARETEYWIELLNKSGYLDNDRCKLMHDDLEEIIKILNSIIITTKKNNN